MNALQASTKRKPVFVTLNPPAPPRPSSPSAATTTAHPQYDRAALAAQARLPGIQGRNHLWFTGAWTGYGFHEDGLKAGLTAAEALGASVPGGPRCLRSPRPQNDAMRARPLFPPPRPRSRWFRAG